MIAVPAGVRVLVATKPVDFRKGADGLVALVRETLGARSVLGNDFCVPLEAGGPGEDSGLGRLGAGAVLEAAGAWCVQVATDHRRRDAADVGATGRAC